MYTFTPPAQGVNTERALVIDPASADGHAALGLYGAADTGISVASVERMKAALSKAGAQGNAAAKACEFVMYPDTPHAFHADYRPSYTQGPAVDGWNRAIAWMKRYL